MDLSPTLDAWLTHFATHVAPTVPWCLEDGRLRVDRETLCCPLQQDWWQRHGTAVSPHPATLSWEVDHAGILPDYEAILVIDAADNVAPYLDMEGIPQGGLLTIRARLLAACGLKENIYA